MGFQVRRHVPTVMLVFGFVATVATAQDARVEYVAGDVWVEQEGSRTPADFGMELETGDRVVTGSDGTAVVTVREGAQIKLRESTAVVIGGETTSVDLQSGGIFARVQRAATGGAREFSVRTPTVVAGVRGTEFFVAYGRTIEELADVWLCVNEGSVEVAVSDSDRVTIVNEGEGINILNGRRPTDPRFFPWTTGLNWNFDPEEGDIRDDTDLDAAYSDLLDQDYD